MTPCDLPHLSRQTWQEPKSPPNATPREDDEKIPKEKLPIEKDSDKDTANEKSDDGKETARQKFKVTKIEEDAVKREYLDEEKDAGRCSEMAAEDQEVEMRHSIEMEGKDGDNEDEVGGKLFVSSRDQQKESKGSVPALAVPEIFVSSPKEKQNLDPGYFLTQIHKSKARQGEGEGEIEVQDSQPPEDENDQVKGLESPHKKENSDENADRKMSKTNNNDANSTDIERMEDNAAGTSDGEEYDTNDQEENDADLSASKENDELLDITSRLLLLDMPSQSEGNFTPPDSCPGSPMSDGDRPESPTYVNLFQGDDLCLLGMEPSPRCSPGNLTPLDPISEHDESEEEKEKEEEGTRKISLPSLFQSKFSSGVNNLSALPGDDNAAQHHSTSEDEAQNTTKDEPDAALDAAQKDAASGGTSKRKRRRKKGRVTREQQSPIFLAEGVRTFSNPISYLGGPNIKYEEEEGDGGGGEGSRQRNDSIVSTASLD